MVQQQAYGFAARPRPGQQHECDLPVVELRAIRISGVNGSFEAARTMLEITGVALVAIQDSDADPAMIRQGFVSLQPVIDMMNSLPQSRRIYQSAHPPDAVGAAHVLSEPATEETGMSGKFQSIEAAHAGPEQHRDGFEDGGCRDTRLPAAVCDACNDSPGKLKDLLGIPDEAAENGQPFLARKRFHSISETSSIRRCISWYAPTAWRTGSRNAFGTQIWRILPAWLCTR
jgi:hypothetical protein